MSNYSETTLPEVSAIVARQIHVAMRVLEQFGQGMNWTAIERIKTTGDKALSMAAGGKTFEVQEALALVGDARLMVSTVWSSMLHDSVIDHLSPAISECNDFLNSLSHPKFKGNDRSSHILSVPNAKALLLEQQERIASKDPLTLSPFERMNHERDLRAIGVGLDADQAVSELLTAKAGPVAEGTEKVSKLNVEFVDEATLRAWLYSMGVRGLLPDSPTFFDEYLDVADQHCHAKRELIDRLITSWGAERPQISPDGLEIAASTLLRSACSTRLDTLQYSSANSVRSALKQTYKNVESVNRTAPGSTKSNDDSRSKARSLNSDLNELESMLPKLRDKLAFVESELAYGVSAQAIKDLMEAMERVEQKADALISNYGPEEEDSPDHRPGM